MQIQFTHLPRSLPASRYLISCKTWYDYPVGNDIIQGFDKTYNCLY